jgi:transposase
LEACATAHYWARELGALGHEVRLMPAARAGERDPNKLCDEALKIISK